MPTKSALVIPILIITVGLGWLLTVQEVMPGVDWIWTLGLAAIGILALVVRGIDKRSIIIGPFCLTASVLSLLRQRELVGVAQEGPILLIAYGVFLLVAQSPAIPDLERSAPPEPAHEPTEPRKLRL
jgi:hypothetical protein